MLYPVILLGSICFSDAREIAQLGEVESNLSNAISYTIKEFFSKAIKYLAISIEVEDYEVKCEFDNILKNVLLEVSTFMPIQIDDSNYISDSKFCRIYLVDSFVSFLKIQPRMDSVREHKCPFHLVVLLQTTNDYYNTMLDIMTIFYFNSIININFMIEPIKGTVLFYTYFPYSRHHCNGVAPILINTFSEGVMWKPDFYPEKTSNFHNCSLRISTLEVPPFIINNPDGKGFASFTGIEGLILKQLGEELNFKIDVVSFKRGKNSSRQFGELFKELRNRTIDFAIGFLFLDSQSKEFSASVSYSHTPINFVVKSVLKPYSPIYRLIMPFDNASWLYTLASFALVFILILFIKFGPDSRIHDLVGKKHNRQMYSMFMISLGNVTPAINRTTTVSKIFLTFWLWEMMILRAVYQGELFDSIRKNVGQKPPNSYFEIRERDFAILMNEHMVYTTHELPRLLAASTVVNMNSLHLIAHLEHSDDEIAIVVPKSMLTYYILRHSASEGVFHVTAKPILNENVCMYFRTNSYLTDSFNRKLLLFASNGLIKSWSARYIGGLVHRPLLAGPRQLTQSQLAGIYKVAASLYGVSFMVFILEILSQNSIMCKRILEFANNT